MDTWGQGSLSPAPFLPKSSFSSWKKQEDKMEKRDWDHRSRKGTRDRGKASHRADVAAKFWQMGTRRLFFGRAASGSELSTRIPSKLNSLKLPFMQTRLLSQHCCAPQSCCAPVSPAPFPTAPESLRLCQTPVRGRRRGRSLCVGTKPALASEKGTIPCKESATPPNRPQRSRAVTLQSPSPTIQGVKMSQMSPVSPNLLPSHRGGSSP